MIKLKNIKRAKKKKMKKPNKVGGGAKTNANGLYFEQTTDLKMLFESLEKFSVQGDYILKDGVKIAELCGKNKIYRNILEPKGINYREILSKKLLPDDAILVDNTVYIIEKKFQSASGSVDEKLQTCDFKKRQYCKLFDAVSLKVEYIYILNDWFKRPEYTDVHNYINAVGCHYYFYELPLEAIGISV